VLRFLWTNSGKLQVALRPLIPEGVGNQIFRWFVRDIKRTTLSPELKQELTDYYRTDIEKLQGLIDRDLSHWLQTTT